MKLLVFFLLLATVALADDDRLEIVVHGNRTSFTLSQLKARLETKTVTLTDPVYRTAKSFDGFALKDILELAGLQPDAAGADLVFTAKDGYAPTTSLANLRIHSAVLAYQEHGTQGGFGKVAQGKTIVSPGPFYLVWEEGDKLADDVPWPYQLLKIEVVNFAQAFDRAFPHGASANAMKGFLVFKDHCIRCHSVNLMGGDIGPELNVPKNITEYWSTVTLKAFIRDATAFRLKSKMPPFPTLTDEDIEHVLDYFAAMKARKM